ncbi:FolC bifunctional protein [Hypoxylon sp. EC38]|nr:FolC bifunctional protein [Hypoxylon sp. EC38]
MAFCLTLIRSLYATRLFRSSFSVNNGNTLQSFIGTTFRQSSTMARTYESALRHLDSIQSNRAITSLFSPPPPAPTSSSPSPSSSSAKPTAQDLNAQAIPEMLAWAQRAGITQDALAHLKCIHVAGTKGKGSVCAYLTAILTRSATAPPVAGTLGTYTSPHLISVRERIQIDGRPISRELFARYFFEVWDALTEAARAEAVRLGTRVDDDEEELRGPATKPFYFRFLTLVALRAAVVECGIGGEYDSTNILPEAAVTAAVVAQLGIDHVGMLGDTVPRIAWNKAGVMKRGRKCFTRRLEGGDGEEETMRVLRRRAQEKGAILVEIEDREVEEWGGVRGNEAGSLEGEFQKYNQALALRAASEHLRMLEGRPDTQAGEEKLSALAERYSDGLRSARLRGRCETREDGDITWFIDGAHTAESLEEVAKWFAGKRKALPDGAKVVLLFNQQERDVTRLLRTLLEGIRRVPGATMETEIFDYAIFTRNDLQGRTADEPERDLSVQNAAAEAMRKLCPGTETTVVDNVAEAAKMVKATAHNDGVKVAVLSTGSLHLVGALLRTLEPDAEL